MSKADASRHAPEEIDAYLFTPGNPLPKDLIQRIVRERKKEAGFA
jgi:hypothetical protein